MSRKKKKYFHSGPIGDGPGFKCEQSVWNRFCKLCEEKPEMLDNFLEAFDECFRQSSIEQFGTPDNPKSTEEIMEELEKK